MTRQSYNGRLSRAEYSRLAYLVKRHRATWYRKFFTPDMAWEKAGLPA